MFYVSSKRGELVLSQVVHVGSNTNNGSNARVFTLNANNDSGNRNRNIGRQFTVVSIASSPLLQEIKTLLEANMATQYSLVA